MNFTFKAKTELLAKFSGETDDKGYTHSPQANLLPGIDLDSVEDDLRRGDGKELNKKFCAIHSSAALAVNAFAPFKEYPEDIILNGMQGANCVEFEKQLRIFRGGRAPNIDVWIEKEANAVAVESKLLEYLTPKMPSFSKAYDRLTPPKSESCWWDLYLQTKQSSTTCYLDRAQLIKHYFGLSSFQSKNPVKCLTLLYIFWEPLNFQEVEVCLRHRQELKLFSEALEKAKIQFRWMTYNQLWDEWMAIPTLVAHAQLLKSRYQVYL